MDDTTGTGGEKTEKMVTRRLIWRLPEMMVRRKIYSRAELQRRLHAIGIEISSPQIGRIYKDMPEMLRKDMLEGLLSVLECTLDDLIEVEIITPGGGTEGDDGHGGNVHEAGAGGTSGEAGGMSAHQGSHAGPRSPREVARQTAAKAPLSKLKALDENPMAKGNEEINTILGPPMSGFHNPYEQGQRM